MCFTGFTSKYFNDFTNTQVIYVHNYGLIFYNIVIQTASPKGRPTFRRAESYPDGVRDEMAETNNYYLCLCNSLSSHENKKCSVSHVMLK